MDQGTFVLGKSENPDLASQTQLCIAWERLRTGELQGQPSLSGNPMQSRKVQCSGQIAVSRVSLESVINSHTCT